MRENFSKPITVYIGSEMYSSFDVALKCLTKTTGYRGLFTSKLKRNEKKKICVQQYSTHRLGISFYVNASVD